MIRADGSTGLRGRSRSSDMVQNRGRRRNTTQSAIQLGYCSLVYKILTSKYTKGWIQLHVIWSGHGVMDAKCFVLF
jgi:hypothetical protein